MVLVEDILTSESIENALSANMGRVLNEEINNVKLRVTALEGSSFNSNNYVIKIWS
jgi:hypothetical protein